MTYIVKMIHLTVVNLEIVTVYEVIFIMKLLSWNWLKRRVSAKIKCCGYFSHLSDGKHGTSPEALRPEDIVVENRIKICIKSL